MRDPDDLPNDPARDREHAPRGFPDGPRDRHAGGWGSLISVTHALLRERAAVRAGGVLIHQNKPDGFACVSCAWAKLPTPHAFEFCENGAKATAAELTAGRVDRHFFERHPLAELETWSDRALEAAGRLVEPMRWDEASDRYVPVAWDEAFAAIGGMLRGFDPKRVVFYTSGRASLEASYLWQLFARVYGHNNLPDSSNMCHESSSVALPRSIGSAVGTVSLEDFERTDCIFHLGQNVGTSSPRMLHQLHGVAERGAAIVVFNPLREPGLEQFIDPQSPLRMLSGRPTRIASHYLQLKNGGDIAALWGVCKALIEADDLARKSGRLPVLDHGFITEHTLGFDAFADTARRQRWDELERVSGLPAAAMREAATVYARAERAMVVYGMGLTQHRAGVDNVAMVCNLLLLRGNIGRPGTGVCAVRGHSNVQGQRTVGISEKPELVPLDRLAALYRFEPPRDKGLNTVEACEELLAGRLQGLIALGGNIVRAAPETGAIERAWRDLPLTVQVATRLNRSHVIHGRSAYLLPCLGRIEIDRQSGGEQVVSIEDSLAHIHASRGRAEPAGPMLRSEPAIVAGLAKATLEPNPAIDWDAWVADYSTIRQAITRTWPSVFDDYEARMRQPGGLVRPVPARQRRWNTPSGKAEFIVPEVLFAGLEPAAGDDGVLQLMTLRSNDQFNTTIYGDDDRFRGVAGTRKVVFMNATDIERLGLARYQRVTLTSAVDDDVVREVRGLSIVAYDLPPGCCGAYFPECNPLVPLWHHAKDSKVPAYKAVPVRVTAE